MMPKQGTLPHTRNSNESKRRRRLTPSQPARLRRRHRIGAASTKRRGCRHQNQAARRRRRQRRRCGGCAQAAFCGAAAAKRVLQGRHVAGSEFMHHAASTFTVSTKNESYNYLHILHSVWLTPKAQLSPPPQFFFSLPPEMYIQSAPNNSNEPFTFLLVQIKLFWVVQKLPLKAKVYYF